MQNTLTSYLSQLLEDGLTKYEIVPFFVVLALIIYMQYLKRN